MLRLIRRLIVWWKRSPTEDDLSGARLQDAKTYASARDYSPPPPMDYFGP